jgi:hypothetical protein
VQIYNTQANRLRTPATNQGAQKEGDKSRAAPAPASSNIISDGILVEISNWILIGVQESSDQNPVGVVAGYEHISFSQLSFKEIFPYYFKS